MLTRLAQRRESLVRRSQEERQRISDSARAVSGKLTLVDMAFGFGQRLGGRPLIMGATLLASLAFGPRKALRWAARAAAIYSAVRQLRRLLGTGA